jgi:hypothetical protein
VEKGIAPTPTPFDPTIKKENRGRKRKKKIGRERREIYSCMQSGLKFTTLWQVRSF